MIADDETNELSKTTEILSQTFLRRNSSADSLDAFSAEFTGKSYNPLAHLSGKVDCWNEKTRRTELALHTTQQHISVSYNQKLQQQNQPPSEVMSVQKRHQISAPLPYGKKVNDSTLKYGTSTAKSTNDGGPSSRTRQGIGIASGVSIKKVKPSVRNSKAIFDSMFSDDGDDDDEFVDDPR